MHETYEDLIIRVLTNNASAEEQASLQRSLTTNPDLASLYHQMARLYGAASPTHHRQFSADAAWQQLRKRIGKK